MRLEDIKYTPRGKYVFQPPDTTDSDIEFSKELDNIQRNIWARINDEANLIGVKLSIGDAYSLGSVIKEVLHPQVQALIAEETRKARIDEVENLNKKAWLNFESLGFAVVLVQSIADRLSELTKINNSKEEKL